jgi:FkbM family methyltransferase
LPDPSKNPSARPLQETEGYWMPRPPSLRDVQEWIRNIETTWDLAKPHVSQFRVAIDVGAHIGMWTRILARNFEKVLAFEPNDYVRQCISRNLGEHSSEVLILPQALGDKPRSVALTMTDETPSIHVYTDREGDLPMVPLDSLYDGPVDLIKMDVEGMEDLVAKGAAKLIEQNKPLIVAEFKGVYWQRYARWGGQQLGETLKEYGYRTVGKIHADLIFKAE